MKAQAASRHHAIIKVLKFIIAAREGPIYKEALREIVVVSNETLKRVRGGLTYFGIARIDRGCVYNQCVIGCFSLRIKSKSKVSGLAIASRECQAKVASSAPCFQHSGMKRFFIRCLIGKQPHPRHVRLGDCLIALGSGY